MDLSNLLTPWLALAAVLFPLAYAERWIHSHLYSVGWLLTNEPRSATVLYYMFLSPGVFVHEFVQWLVAGALNVETRRVMAWPEAQEDGTLRLDFVQIAQAGRFTTAVIGAAPLIVGLAIIAYISTSILDLDAYLDAFQSGDITIIGPAARELASTADFYLWLYLMFAIANAMLPTPEERSGWLIVIGIFAVLMAFLVLIGVGDVLVETFTGPVAHGVNLLTAAFGTILALDVAAILIIGFFEEVLERVTRRKFDYSTEEPEKFVREPGSNLPLEPGQPFPSIYNLDLPLPDPAIQPDLDAKKRRAAAPAAGPERPGASPARATAEAPGLPRRDTASAPRPAASRGAVEDRPAPAGVERREAPARAAQPAPPRREPFPAASRAQPGERSAAERPGQRTGSPLAPVDRASDRPFASRPVAGPPASPDRARPPAPDAAPLRKPASAPPRRPFIAEDAEESDHARDRAAPGASAADDSETPDDELEYIDFDDL